MNTMPGNPHADGSLWDRADSHINATLAAAFEQRTANLIDLHEILIRENRGADANALLGTINSRLGQDS